MMVDVEATESQCLLAACKMRDQDCSTSSESSALDCRGSVLVQTVGTKDARVGEGREGRCHSSSHSLSSSHSPSPSARSLSARSGSGTRRARCAGTSALRGYDYSCDRRQHCYVTGGSSGLGLALALLLTKRGADVSIVARDQVKLDNALEEMEVGGYDEVGGPVLNVCGAGGQADAEPGAQGVLVLPR
jgi:hypothetical protein